MKKLDEETVCLIAGIVCVLVSIPLMFYLAQQPEARVKLYECSISEISPDIPLDVKEACRKANAERIK